jgi:hypothetical protein
MIAKVVINQMQIDIMKSESCSKTSTSVSVCIRIPWPGSPTSEDDPYYKNNKYL